MSSFLAADDPVGGRSPKRRRTSAKQHNESTTTYTSDDEAKSISPSLRTLHPDIATPVISINSPAPPSHEALTPQPVFDSADDAEGSSTPHSDDSNSQSRYSPMLPGGTPQEYPPEIRYKPTLVLRGHKRGVAAVKISPDGKWIASCSADASLKVWHTSTGHLNCTLQGHLAGVSTVAWAPDSVTLASGSDDKTIRLWNILTGAPQSIAGTDGKKTPREPFLGHHNYIYCVAFSPKGNMLVSSSYDEAVHLWDVRSGALLRSLPAHSDPVGGVDFVRDGTLIVSCSSDGLIRVWDSATGQCLRTFFHEDTPPAVSVKFSPNGKYILAWMLDSCLRMWNYVEGRCVKTYQGHVNRKFSLSGAFGTYGDVERIGGVETQDLSGNDKPKTLKRAFVVSGSEDGSILIWDVVSKNVLQRLHGHDGVVLGVDTHPTQKLIVSCGADKTVRMWQDLN